MHISIVIVLVISHIMILHLHNNLQPEDTLCGGSGFSRERFGDQVKTILWQRALFVKWNSDHTR